MDEHRVAVWKYQTDEAIIVPYVGGMISPVFPEDFLCRLYFKLKFDGSLRRTLPDESIHSLTAFVSYFKGKSMALCYKKMGPGVENALLGAVWLYDHAAVGSNSRASVGVFFFKEYWGQPDLAVLGKLALQWIFDTYKLTVLIGTIAGWNRASVRFGKIMGFQVCGVVPRFFLKADSSTDMVMVALKREDFNGQG